MGNSSTNRVSLAEWVQKYWPSEEPGNPYPGYARKSAPWKKTAPKKAGHTKLTPRNKAKAKASAKRAGREYPNLVDNMKAARIQKEKRSSAKK